MCASDIFGFGAGKGDSALLLGASGYGAPCKGECITQSGLMVIDVTAPVSIHVPKYSVVPRDSAVVHELVVQGATKVSEKMVKGELVLSARIGGMVTKSCDRIHYIRTSFQHQIHKGAKGLLKVFSIYLRQREMDKMIIGK